MKPEKMENLAHQLVEIRNNLELQTISIDMLTTLSNLKQVSNPLYGRYFTERLTSTLYNVLQDLSNKVDEIAFELYQAAEKSTEQIKLESVS